ncbi:alpha-N-acetyl-neuraminyl-2,3-beta-galactosyl-1,3-N-acetyl-galactosaminide alpha-2,6-sialyltransferase isoform X2 [Scleropages formosus]|nr:alpha-N-acetyl-neuraminyl-2,3-beta-galactosyl-1,3-N-acetyl-galactosaminide alpha-2,6-sialyltransferase isoform X2 [Scleropages formosus]
MTKLAGSGGDVKSSLSLPGYVRITPGKMDQFLDIHNKQCALVSSSGQMLNAGLGKEIDKADFVIRMNNAPTQGFERDVGNKTSLRVVSHTTVPWLLKNEIHYFQQSASTIYVIWGPENKMRQDGKGPIFNALMKVAKKYPNVKLYAVTRKKIQDCDNIFQNETGKNRMQSGAFLSTGFFTMILAMDICDNIQVYGMINDSYCGQVKHKRVPYHYYEKSWIDECRMYNAHEKARHGGHRFITEKAIYARWASQKHVYFKNPSWAL